MFFYGYHAISSCCQSTARLQSQYFSQKIVLWKTLPLFFFAKYITRTNLVLLFQIKVLKNLNINILFDLSRLLPLVISDLLSYHFPMAYIIIDGILDTQASETKAFWKGTLSTRGAFFALRAHILSWPRIMCSQVRMLKFLEPSQEMP